jgi:hypothetical protein
LNSWCNEQQIGQLANIIQQTADLSYFSLI